MFDIFIKRKQLVLDCFTHMPFAYNFCKPDKGSKFMPEWWTKTKLEDTPRGLNIKYCQGLIDFYKKGFVLPSWFSLELTLYPDQTYFYKHTNDHFEFQSHTSRQFKGFALQNGYNFKIDNVWRLRTKKKVYFCWSQPTWSMRSTMFNLSILPGALNFYNQHHAAINMFVEYTDQQKQINIEPMEPLAMLHPLTEDELVIKHHLISGFEYESIFGIRQTSFFGKDITDPNIDVSVYDRLKYYKKWIRNRDKILDRAYNDPDYKDPFDHLTEKDNGKQK